MDQDYQVTSLNAPDVTFVTVYFNTPDATRALLKSFENARFGFTHEYYLIDNNPAARMGTVIQQDHPWIQVILSPKNLGFGVGNNIGMQRARGRYVILVNPDLMIAPGEMEQWIKWMDEHQDVGISGPRVLNPDGTDQHSCYRFHSLMTPLYRRTILGKTPWGKRALNQFLMTNMDRSQESDVDWVLGAAMCIRREVLERIGYFDPRFFMYFEDADLCHRAWEAGFRVTYTPAARFTHEYQHQSRTRHVWDALTNKLARIHIASGIKFFLKHFGKPNPRMKISR